MTEKEISTKRRATMNSRRTDEEDEMLRRAIEESKGEAGTLGKRPRDDSEEYDGLIDTPTSRPLLTTLAVTNMVRSASGPSQALLRRYPNKVALHHSHLAKKRPQSSAPMATQV
jgi:hypothetical protein